MRELIKYLLGIVIILTIIYTIFISYNVFVFINSDESKITIEDYSESMIIDSQKREALEELFNSENLNISFNSKYLIDIASEVENTNLKMNLKDSVSPVLIEDISDKNSYYVIMPMKI